MRRMIEVEILLYKIYIGNVIDLFISFFSVSHVIEKINAL